MKQHITEISAETLIEAIAKANELLEMIDNSSLHTIIQEHSEYRAIIVCSYTSSKELNKIKSDISYLELKSNLLRR